jgi:hypothetical protein
MLYETIVRDSMQRIEESEGIERRGLVLATLMKLKSGSHELAHLLPPVTSSVVTAVKANAPRPRQLPGTRTRTKLCGLPVRLDKTRILDPARSI